MKKKLCIFAIVCTLIAIGIIAFNLYNSKKDLYSLYFNDLGNPGSIVINGIDNKKISYSNLDLKKDGMIADTIVQASKDKIYATVSIENDKLSNKVLVISNNKIEKSIELDNHASPNVMINDKEKNKVYVSYALRPSKYNPDGIPIKVIDSKEDKIVKSMSIKGGIIGYDINGDSIYVLVSYAEKLGFTNTSNSYLLKINRETSECKVLTNINSNISPRDIKISPNGKIYVTSSSTVAKDNNKYTLNVYSKNGEFIKEVELPKWCDKIAIDSHGTAFISHRGKQEMYDDSGDSITVYDTNNDKIIGKISGLVGPCSMQVADDHLYVSNYKDSSISVIDVKKQKIIGKINIDGNLHFEQLIVEKMQHK